jgi:2-methylcitrate dehydratase PrpD
MSVAEELVDWAWSLTAADVPPSVVSKTCQHILDGLGVALAARRLGTASYAATVASSFGAGTQAHIVGDRNPTTATGAAFANGILVHALDFDDTHTQGLVHVTAATLPAALAVAEETGRTGQELIEAIVVGYEVIARLGSATRHGFHARGFHATSVCGTFASALIAARLYGLSPDQAVNALGIAGSQSSGSMEFLSTGAATKQIHPGWASLAGLVAARLAGAGATGPGTVFEGERGLYRLFTDTVADTSVITEGLSTRWMIDGIAMKPYPACHLMHRTLDAARRVHGQVKVGDIAEIVVEIAPDSVPIVGAPETRKQSPRTSYEAKFSVQWSVAAMLTAGAVQISTYLPEELERRDLRELAARVRLDERRSDVPAAEAPGQVTVRTNDGGLLVGTSDPAPAATDNDPGQVFVDKFRANAASSAADELIATVSRLALEPDTTRLSALLGDVADSWSPQPAHLVQAVTS